MLRLCQVAANESRVSNIVLSLSVHNFVDESELGSKVFTMKDDGIDTQPIFLLCVRRSYLLHVSVEHQYFSNAPFLGIKRLDVLPDDGQRTALQIIKSIATETKLEAVGVFNPDQCDSTKLQLVSPFAGDLQQKYVAVELLVGVVSEVGSTQELDMKVQFFCRMHSSDCQFLCRKFMRFAAHEWERTPQWIKVLSREAAVSAGVAIGTFI